LKFDVIDVSLPYVVEISGFDNARNEPTGNRFNFYLKIKGLWLFKEIDK
jgi:hypothetical protein